MPALADLLVRALDPATDPAAVAGDVTAWRQQFTGIHFTAGGAGILEA